MVLKKLKINLDKPASFAIIVFAMSNYPIETLTALVRKQYISSGYDDVHQWAKERMSQIWYGVAIGGIKIELANDLEKAIANVRYEIGGGW